MAKSLNLYFGKLSVFFLLNIFIFIFSQRVFSENILSGFGGVGLNSYHYGSSFLMYVSEMHAWGPEVVYYKKDIEKYLSVCIVLEARLFKIWINQMGLAGYIGDRKAKPFGVRLSTGLNIPIKRKISSTFILRTDVIFDERIIHSNNIELGIRFKL